MATSPKALLNSAAAASVVCSSALEDPQILWTISMLVMHKVWGQNAIRPWGLGCHQSLMRKATWQSLCSASERSKPNSEQTLRMARKGLIFPQSMGISVTHLNWHEPPVVPALQEASSRVAFDKLDNYNSLFDRHFHSSFIFCFSLALVSGLFFSTIENFHPLDMVGLLDGCECHLLCARQFIIANILEVKRGSHTKRLRDSHFRMSEHLKKVPYLRAFLNSENGWPENIQPKRYDADA